jgi:hypothetical protein
MENFWQEDGQSGRYGSSIEHPPQLRHTDVHRHHQPDLVFSLTFCLVALGCGGSGPCVPKDFARKRGFFSFCLSVFFARFLLDPFLHLSLTESGQVLGLGQRSHIADTYGGYQWSF